MTERHTAGEMLDSIARRFNVDPMAILGESDAQDPRPKRRYLVKMVELRCVRKMFKEGLSCCQAIHTWTVTVASETQAPRY